MCAFNMDQHDSRGKRKAVNTSESSLETSGELTEQKRKELLRKARKKARQQRNDNEPLTSIKAHFASVATKKTDPQNKEVFFTMAGSENITLVDIMKNFVTWKRNLAKFVPQ